MFVRESLLPVCGTDIRQLIPFVSKNRYLGYSSMILIGITVIVISLYPEFSAISAEITVTWIAMMIISSIIAVLAASRVSLSPVTAIRLSAILMGFGVVLTFYPPAVFIVIGALAGIVMIAQMAFLAGTDGPQGFTLGLYSTTSYLGMAILPFFAGLVADSFGFFLHSVQQHPVRQRKRSRRDIVPEKISTRYNRKKI
ncbi:MAG: hypothetical protein WCF90_00875 [Methanomicrobiales archaeon]